MKIKIVGIIIVALSALVGSCASEEEKQPVQETPAVEVSVKTPSRSQQDFFRTSGRIEAQQDVTLSTRQMGFIEQIHVSPGDRVSRGQLLVSINNQDLQAQLAQLKAGVAEARAAYSTAKRDLDRYQSLYEDESVSRKELEDQSTNYEMARARLEAAEQMEKEIEAQFAYARIRAPFDGVVTNRFAEAGNMTRPGQPLLSVEAPDAFEVITRIPEERIASVEPGNPVEVRVSQLEEPLEGRVSELSSSARETGGQFVVHVDLARAPEGLFSGMYAEVSFPLEKTSERAGSLYVDQEALIRRGDLQGVYTLSSQGTAILRWLRLGRSTAGQVEVLSGLSADEPYILKPEGRLFNGAKVTLRNQGQLGDGKTGR